MISTFQDIGRKGTSGIGLAFGLSEIVVYGDRFEPGYLNPITIYLINEQPISRADGRVPGSGDNVMMSVDMRLRPYR